MSKKNIKKNQGNHSNKKVNMMDSEMVLSKKIRKDKNIISKVKYSRTFDEADDYLATLDD